ncbi:MAG TPA: glycerol kinase GlpK [Alphaproteobacteria bacterium]|nr:glycerol kinase GlpK [Alphaproteobacteria bacterium]
MQAILSIDQGTTSTRSLLVNEAGEIVASHSQSLAQYFPQDGWVEHDGEEILNAVIACARRVLEHAEAPGVIGIGLTNQRETTLIWNRRTGKPLHRAIVWQDRRTQLICDRLRADGRELPIQDKTGLVLDPYFSGAKLSWLLDNVEGARALACEGELAFGTVDSWLIYALTGGSCHVTDATNASRTMLYDIRTGRWDPEILAWLGIPESVLPEVLDSAADFGITTKPMLGAELRILGVAGDQQAAMIGQACLKPGMVKSTYGTGCFMLMNTGEEAPRSRHKLLGTIAYRLGGKATYALEGSIFVAGATLDWLRDVGVLNSIEEAGALAARASPNSRAILVPGFTGLGAPYWNADARGAILGMTRDTGKAEIAGAALDAAAFQTRDLLEAMAADTGVPVKQLRVDGGMAKSDEFVQRLANLTGVEVLRAATTETTGLGAAYLAGLKAGLLKDLTAIEKLWRAEASFYPRITTVERDARYEAWKRALRRVL